MPKPTPDLDPSLCACGRDVAEAASVSYRATSGRYLFRRCDCGAEWTQQLDQVDRSEPVSTDEVLEVHEQLAQFSGGISDLLGLSPAT
jgi:hypothetical protein